MSEKAVADRHSVVLVLRPDRDKDRKDYTNAFKPASDAFVSYHVNVARRNVILREIDISKPALIRKSQVLSIVREIVKTSYIDAYVLYCHGWPSGVQIGFTKGEVAEFAKAIRDGTPIGNYCLVAIYGCLTGDGPAMGDGNFADLVRDELCRLGLDHNRVMGHSTAGRCDANPHVRIYDGMGNPDGGRGGYWMVEPSGPLWNVWKERLEHTDLVHRFTFMDVAKVHAELTT